jgi:hypothetical protein
MRTTIEITSEHRARLVELAARRGEKGFSHLIQEALDTYLKAQAKHDEQRRRALMLKGILGAREAERLREASRTIRESWR